MHVDSGGLWVLSNRHRYHSFSVAMKWIVSLPVVLVLSFGCGSGGEAPVESPSKPETLGVAIADIDAPWPAKLPAHLGAEGSNAITDAIQVWRVGVKYFDAPQVDVDNSVEAEEEEIEVVETVEPDPKTPNGFRGMDHASEAFLTTPTYADSAVQFSCAITAYAGEYHHVQALDADDALIRLQALVVLMKVKAPRTVAKQWQALESLQNLPDRPGVARLLGELRAAFEYPALKPDLMRAPPADEYKDDHGQQWAARAAGAAKCWQALPRLRELSVCDNLNTNLAAERSLIDYDGPQADEALQHCVLGWKYNAWIRAAGALLKRAPRLLEETLLEAKIPDGARYQAAVFLGRLGNADAVPMLCEEVGGVQRIDKQMFDLIEALADERHRAAIQALPDQVRENQRERAESVRATVVTRLDPSR